MKKLLKSIIVFISIFMLTGCALMGDKDKSESDLSNNENVPTVYKNQNKNEDETSEPETEFAFVGDLDTFTRNFKRLEGKEVKVTGLWDLGYFVSFDNTGGIVTVINDDIDTSMIEDGAVVAVSGKAVNNYDNDIFYIEATSIDYANPVNDSNLYWNTTTPFTHDVISECFNEGKVISNDHEGYFIMLNGEYKSIGTYAIVKLNKVPTDLRVPDGTIVRFLVNNIKESALHKGEIDADIVEYNIEGTMF